MKRILILIGLLFGGILMPAADQAIGADLWSGRPAVHGRYLPFPRSERAQSVWAAGACWSECGSYCAWGMANCLKRDSQGICLQRTDTCDRYCQRECRTRGGPLVGLID